MESRDNTAIYLVVFFIALFLAALGGFCFWAYDQRSKVPKATENVMDKTATIKAGISIMYQPNLELILGPHIQDGILDGCFDSLPYGANRPRKNPQKEAVLAQS